MLYLIVVLLTVTSYLLYRQYNMIKLLLARIIELESKTITRKAYTNLIDISRQLTKLYETNHVQRATNSNKSRVYRSSDAHLMQMEAKDAENLQIRANGNG